MGKVMNEHEAAKLMGVQVQTLRNWRSLRKGPPYLKLGSSVRYSEDDVVAYLRSRRVDPNN
jgi:predicted site-specific integrase-resolvase